MKHSAFAAASGNQTWDLSLYPESSNIEISTLPQIPFSLSHMSPIFRISLQDDSFGHGPPNKVWYFKGTSY